MDDHIRMTDVKQTFYQSGNNKEIELNSTREFSSTRIDKSALYELSFAMRVSTLSFPLGSM